MTMGPMGNAASASAAAAAGADANDNVDSTSDPAVTAPARENEATETSQRTERRTSGRTTRNAASKSSPDTSESEGEQLTAPRRGHMPKYQRDGTAKPKDAVCKPTSKKDGVKSDSSDDEPGDYVHVEVGNCVLLDSGDPKNHFVALVSSVQLSHNGEPGSFSAQWYYKPDDVEEDVLATIKGGVLPNEVFLSPHKDKNSIDAVVGFCNVISPEEYNEIERDIKRGFREKSIHPTFVCRFKYFPKRSVKRALERLKDVDIHAGLGPPKPNIGDQYQADVPTTKEDKPIPVVDTSIPWKTLPPVCRGQPLQIWSPEVPERQELIFRQCRELADTLRFAVGNIVKVFTRDEKRMGHVRGVILKYDPTSTVQVSLSTGQVREVLRSDVCSPLTDDIALRSLYVSRFNLSRVALECSKLLAARQGVERDAFLQEVQVYARAKELQRAREDSGQEEYNSNPKRRK